MADVDGEWECTATTPMGPQQFTLKVKSDGNRFDGAVSGALGSIDIPGGTIDGDTLNWSMGITMPFPMQLSIRATVNGDALQGSVDAGALGAMPLTGVRKA